MTNIVLLGHTRSPFTHKESFNPRRHDSSKLKVAVCFIASTHFCFGFLFTALFFSTKSITELQDWCMILIGVADAFAGWCLLHGVLTDQHRYTQPFLLGSAVRLVGALCYIGNIFPHTDKHMGEEPSTETDSSGFGLSTIILYYSVFSMVLVDAYRQKLINAKIRHDLDEEAIARTVHREASPPSYESCLPSINITRSADNDSSQSPSYEASLVLQPGFSPFTM